MPGQTIPFADLENRLHRMPVLADVHPLVPLALPEGTRIVSDSAELLAELDSPQLHRESNLLLLETKSPLAQRLPVVLCQQLPSLALLNERLPFNLAYARRHLLRTIDLAAHISQDVACDMAYHMADVIVFYLVDGLSYWDVGNWPFDVQPCFVDGPSVTYRFIEGDEKQINELVGFPGIIGRPPLAERLYGLGYQQARGYSYWDRENIIADYMFRGVSLTRISSFEGLVALLREAPLQPPTFIQIVQEGLDGLAHHRRELRPAEIEAAIDKIRIDVSMLVDWLKASGYSATIYLTADHGILWRTEHPFRPLLYSGERQPRYARVTTSQDAPAQVTRFLAGNVSYDLFHYPYLAKDIKSNDSGVHGGLSAQESIVPLVKIRG